MSVRVVGSDNYFFFYDDENRLVEVQKNNSIIANYFYDADGKMVKKVEGGDTTVHIGNYLEVNIPEGALPTPTSTQIPMPTSTRTLPPTRTLFFTYTPMNSRTPTITKTATATPIPTNTGLPTNTKTSTPTNTRTYTITPTRTRTPSKTAGPSSTPTVTRTKTPTATITKTPTITQTRTRTPTNTSYAPTKTYTPTISPTVTNTVTRTPTQTYTVTPTSIAPSGQVWKFYYYVGSTRIAERETSQFVNIVYFLFSDHLGSTTVVANTNGEMLSQSLYQAWGESRYASGANLTDYGYTGQRKEAGIGLYYYNARWYDPTLGRFVQADTYVPESQGVQAWDRYTYANNNPIKYNDPSGHCILCLIIAIGGGVILGTAIYNNFIRTPSAPADGNASTLLDLILLGYEHADHANIVGEGLQSLKADPSVQGAQSNIISQIKSAPQYGNQPFSPKNLTSQSFTADGPTDNFAQAAIDGNPAFWMVHTGTLSATNTTVASDGTITTTWKVDDSFDYIPDWNNHERTHYWEYNIFATVVHFGYNTLLGAGESYTTNAYWNQTISPPNKLTPPKQYNYQ